MTKEIHKMNSNAMDFVAELIDYIFTYPDDDYMTMECLCRKLHKYGLIDKQDGEYTADTPQTERKNCTLELFDDDGNHIEPQTDCAWMYDSRRDYEYDKALDEWKDFEEFDDGEDGEADS